jgi:GDPmannose 4,6-dehydratase
MQGSKRALITGISGQDGTYLAEHLQAQGREVYGIGRGETPARVAAVARRVARLDVRDHEAVATFIREVEPTECYHLAAFHHSSAARSGQVDVQAEEILHLQTNLLATHALLAAMHRYRPSCRVFLAGSCRMFGVPGQIPQKEDTPPLNPDSMYGIMKLAAQRLGALYRSRHRLFCCTGILYNHESPLRGPEFVTARIVREVLEIAAGRRKELVIGDLEATVDWGFAGDYVEAMRLMLEAKEPADYVIASGRLSRVGDFVELAFGEVGLDWKSLTRQDPRVYSAPSAAVYHGDASRIFHVLGWRPKTSLAQLVRLMVDHQRGGQATERPAGSAGPAGP